MQAVLLMSWSHHANITQCCDAFNYSPAGSLTKTLRLHRKDSSLSGFQCGPFQVSTSATREDVSKVKEGVTQVKCSTWLDEHVTMAVSLAYGHSKYTYTRT
ncbi:hypothetical protein ILYODFUR_018620 [Ilyodon furcidens]|uniref:Uncharacterized protein n=1 Tax=Ilyodon furcidens TaxID=33524 RepID=A0ABV0SMB5_9TELE